MKKKTQTVARHDEHEVPGSRVVRRAPRVDAATTDITIPRLDVYGRRQPAQPDEPPTRDLASAFGSELAYLSRRAGERVRAAVAPLRKAGASVARGARRTLEKNSSITMAAAGAGLLAGVVLAGFPPAAPPHAAPAGGALAAAGMCEAPPEPISLLRPRARLSTMALHTVPPTPRPAKVRAVKSAPSRPRAPAKARLARAPSAPPRKRVVSPPTPVPVVQPDPGSQARRNVLLEEARRAEKAELATAYYERSAKRRQTRVAGR